MHYKESFSEKAGRMTIYIVVIMLTMAFIYPVIYCLSMSLSDSTILGGQNIGLLPKGFSFSSYQYLLSSNKMFQYYMNTILYAAVGTLITLLTTSLIAYSLSVPVFSARKPVTIFLVITMFFSGGLVPYYLLIQRMGLMDTIWPMVLPGISAYNVMIYKTFFKQIPSSLKEAAKIDGAGHFRVLFTIILPLSKSLLATMALFSIVGHWNSYINAVLYLRSPEKYPIQMFLRSLLVTLDMREEDIFGGDAAMQMMTSSRTVKCAGAMIAMIPILCIYPFMQKYFAKGVMVGSVKG
ncbi:MAG: carbohydrate ABC transporter permease [Clostridiaceae bacterium]|nr:carbohydrate ABC transporter permease [Clostridiaceae bacterium]